MRAASVPDFHERDRKLDVLVPGELPADDYSSRCVAFLKTLEGGSLEGLRILDIGCGRGDLVYRLRALGARAFGVEIEPRYLASGKALNEIRDDFAVLSIAQPGQPLPYPDGYFDRVVSFQVLEHVADLDAVAGEVARVLRPGGKTVHVLPAKYRVREPHYFLPFVHWLPKNRWRKRAISTLLALGLARSVLPGHRLSARAQSIYAYANEQTFYRAPGRITKAFTNAGLVADTAGGARALIKSRLPWLPFTSGLAAVMNVFRTTVFEARKPAACP